MAYKASDPDNYCIENGTNLSTTTTTCAAGKFVVGKRYVISADYVVFNESSPNGGTGSAAPIFDYLTSSYTPLPGYVNGAIAVNETAVSWANVATSWKKVAAVLTMTNAMKRIAFSVKNSSSSRATSGILFDNTSFEQLSVTASGISPVTCNGTSTGRIFTLNPSSNYGGVPNLKYRVTVPSGYTIVPTTGIYGQTTSFTLLKTGGSSIGTGNLTITIADDVNTNCSITQTVSDPSPCTATCSLSATAVGTNPTCPNNDGVINLTVTGATGTPTFVWSNAATSEDLTALSAGAYSVTVTEGTCTTTTSINIEVIPSNIPYPICPGETYKLEIQDNTLTGIQWKKDGVDIAGANGLTYNATQVGVYTYTSNGVGGCAVGQCCPIELTASTNCCKPVICTTVKITKK